MEPPGAPLLVLQWLIMLTAVIAGHPPPPQADWRRRPGRKASRLPAEGGDGGGQGVEAARTVSGL
jgi:hypothetical protein